MSASLRLIWKINTLNFYKSCLFCLNIIHLLRYCGRRKVDFSDTCRVATLQDEKLCRRRRKFSARRISGWYIWRTFRCRSILPWTEKCWKNIKIILTIHNYNKEYKKLIFEWWWLKFCSLTPLKALSLNSNSGPSSNGKKQTRA